MLKARFLLSALMVALVAGAFQIYDHPAMGDGDKNILYFLDGLLFLSAGILTTVNLFSLDEDGRIPHNSVPYRFLHYWNNGKVPKQLKLCPMFWGIFGVLAMTAVGVLMLSFFGYALLYMLCAGIKFLIVNPHSVLVGLGWASLVLTAIATVWVTLRELLKLFRVKEAGAASWMILILSGLVFLFGSALAKSNITPAAGLLVAVKIILVLTLTLGIAAAMLAALVFLVTTFFPKLRDSFLSQLIMAGLGKLCPVIEVETEPKPKENDYYDPLLFI